MTLARCDATCSKCARIYWVTWRSRACASTRGANCSTPCAAVEEGGRGEDDLSRRHQRLARAVAEYDWIDLEADRDLTPELLGVIPPERRLISWHGAAGGVDELSERFATMAGHSARFYKLVANVRAVRDALEPLALLHALQRDDVVAFATGTMATWTRLVALRLGAPAVYGYIGTRPAAAGATVGRRSAGRLPPGTTPIGDQALRYRRQPRAAQPVAKVAQSRLRAARLAVSVCAL